MTGSQKHNSTINFPVVAVGASAGGLEALEQLFAAFEPPTGMAFVVLQHLSPDFESRMDQLLRRHTSMEVQVAVNQVLVEPDHIYLIPPRMEMIISSGRLLLTTKEPSTGLNLPIDHFMRSLANDIGREAIAIVLSGSGSDGSRGAREVEAAGGLVLAQLPEQARFDSMPRSVLATGSVHLAVAVETMAEVLRRYIDDGLTPARVAVQFRDEVPSHLREVFDRLRALYGIDFADYKPKTVERRIERRIGLVRDVDLDHYIERLRNDRAELDALYHDLLIGVTEFFRDPEVFRALEHKVVPGLVDDAIARGTDVRVWSAGVATGEEAYSLAMLLLEECERRSQPPGIKVFGTDVHKVSLERASTGVYSATALANLSNERRERWFTRESGDNFRVKPKLRSAVVFAPHNALVDAPFTRLDLVSCRNLLIYFRPASQRKVLSLFHFGLRTGGFMLLGSSETTGDLADEFETIQGRRRLYRKVRDVRLPVEVRAPAFGPRPLSRARAGGRHKGGDPRLGAVYDQLLARYMPPAILVDDQYQLLHSFGGAERYISMPAGRPSQNVLDLVEPELKTTVSGALQHAEKDGHQVRYIGLSSPRVGHRVDLSVEPMTAGHADLSCFLLSFEARARVSEDKEETEVTATEEGESLSHDADYISALEDELNYARENLQATVEELETSNEELQASNEELQASNEELQSTNEELHSVNEELYTVNSEYQRKIDELFRANADFDNLLDASEVAVVFLDEDLQIRRYTRRAAEIFGLLPHDHGREFASFALRIDDRQLLADARGVIADQSRVAREVEDREGLRYLLRLSPYELADRDSNKGRGVVVTLVELESIRQTEARARRLSAIVETSNDAIISQNLDGSVETWNEGGRSLLGWTDEDVVGKPLARIVVGSVREEFERHEQRARQLGMVERFESLLQAKNGEHIDVIMTVAPLRDRHELIGLSTTARDIRDSNRARERVSAAVHQREVFLAMLSHELRNPLAALAHASRVLDEDIDASLRGETTQIIRRQVDHMARLLEDLLDVSRIRRGKIEMRFEPVRVATVFEHVSEAVTPLFEATKISLDVVLEDPELIVSADLDRLRQVLVNLLSNAAKFSPSGAEVRLEGSHEHDPSGQSLLRLSVSDEGAGLTSSELDEVFEPFIQGRRNRLGGLGLGLALVRSITEAHGGRVEASSPGPNRGSTFTVRLPLSRKDVEGRSISIADNKTAANSGVRPHARGRTIVLVEDDDNGRMMLAVLLEAHGFDIATAADGPSGLALILEQRPDFAIIDIGLPGMSGLELADKLRDEDHQTRLIALTGYGQQSDREAVFAAGFEYHFVKPVDTDLLEAALLDQLDDK